MSWDKILEKLQQKRGFSKSMGGEERLDRHRGSGKLNARERLELLFDLDSFQEIGRLAGNLSEDRGAPAPADGLIAGFGMINGRPALAMAEDFTVMGGSIGDAGASKRQRITQMALQENLPLVTMLEGAGHRPTNEHANPSPNDLQGLAELSGKVPLVCLVMGASAGHGALAAPLSDFVVMTKAASMFVAGPPIVKAAIGETVTKEELGGPDVHLSSGVAHNLAENDEEAILLAKQYLSFLGSDAEGEGPRSHDAILDIIPPDPRQAFNVGPVAELLCDADSLFEIQPSYGRALFTAYGRLGGQAVAIVANNPIHNAGAVDAHAAQKAARFIEKADDAGLPIIFLTDNPGVQPGSASEKTGMLLHAAEMFKAQHRIKSPKLHVTMRKAFGFGSSIMGMNPFDNQTISIAFPAINLGAMPATSGSDAAGLSAEEKNRIVAEQTASAWSMADKMVFDDIIDPRELRNVLLKALAMTDNRKG